MNIQINAAFDSGNIIVTSIDGDAADLEIRKDAAVGGVGFGL